MAYDAVDLAAQAPLGRKVDAVDLAAQTPAYAPPAPEIRSRPATDLPWLYGNEFTKGLRRGALGVKGTAQGFAAQVAEPFAPRFADELFAEANKTLDFERGLQPKVPTWDDVKDTSSFIDYGLSKMGEAAPTTAASLGAAAVGGAAGLGLRALTGARLPLGFAAGAGSMLPQEGGEAAMTMRNDPQAMANTTPWSRLGLATGKGAINAALEFTPEAIALNRAFGSPLLRRGFAPAAGAVAKGMGEAALGEGLTEGLQEKVGQMFHAQANPARDTSGDPVALREAVLGGAFGGLGFGAAGGAGQAIRSNLAPPEIQMPDAQQAMEHGYKTAEFIDQNVRRAADSILRFVSERQNSAVASVRAQESWDKDKQKRLEEWLTNPKYGKTLSQMPVEHQRAIISAMDTVDNTPEAQRDDKIKQLAGDIKKVFGEAPKLDTTQFDDVGTDPNAVKLEDLQHNDFGDNTKLVERTQDETDAPLETPVPAETIRKSLFDKKWFREPKSDKPQGHLTIRLRAADGSMTSQEIIDALSTENSAPGTARKNFAEMHISPFSLVNQLQIDESAKAEAAKEAGKEVNTNLPDIRKGQSALSDSRKGDLFVNAMGTLLSRGIVITDKNGVARKIDVKVDQIPKNLGIGQAFKRDSGLKQYTIEDYTKEKESFFRKPLSLLKLERDIATRFLEGKPNSEAITDTIARREKQRKEAAEGSPRRAQLNERWAALKAFEEERQRTEKKMIEEWGKTPEKAKAQSAKATAEFILKKNATNTVKEGLQVIGDNLEPIVMDDPGGKTQDLIENLVKYLDSNGEVATQDVIDYFDANNVPLFEADALTDEHLKNKQGVTPQDRLRDRLEYWRNRAAEGALSGTLSQDEINDIEQVERDRKDMWGSGNNLAPADLTRAPKVTPQARTFEAEMFLDDLSKRAVEYKDAAAKYAIPQKEFEALRAHLLKNVRGLQEYGTTAMGFSKEALASGRDLRKEVEAALRGSKLYKRTEVGQRQGELSFTKSVVKARREVVPEAVVAREVKKMEDDREKAEAAMADMRPEERSIVTTPEETSKSTRSLPMNYYDGYRNHDMRPEFRGKSTMDLIKSGDRTATTRNTKPEVKVGEVLRAYDNKGNEALIRVTKAAYPTSEVTPAEWSKLEGWSEKDYKKYRNAWQFQYELADKPASKTEEVTAKPLSPKDQLQAERTQFAEGKPSFTYPVNKSGGNYTAYGKLTDAEKSKQGGKTLTLVRQPENKADTNAISVQLNGEHITFIPKAEAALMAPRVDQGKWGYVAQLDTTGKHVLVRAEKVSDSKAEPATPEKSEPKTTEKSETPKESIESKLLITPETPVKTEESKVNEQLFTSKESEAPFKPSQSTPAAPEIQQARTEAPQRLADIIKKIFGKKVEVIVGEPPKGLKGVKQAGQHGWYAGRQQLDEFKANEKAIQEVREARRKALAQGNQRLADELLDREQVLLKQNEVLGTIYLSPKLSEAEQLTVLYHEALHAAFDILLKPEERAALAVAFSRGLVRQRLEQIFKDDPEALAQIKDAEEAAAYGFQIYAAAPHLLQLGPETQTIFGKIKKWFKELLSIMSPEEKAVVIMNDMLSGRRAESGLSSLQRVLDKDAPFHQRIGKHAQALTGVVKKFWEVTATPLYNRLISMDNPAIEQIARLGYTQTGEKSKPGMIQQQQVEISARLNWVNKFAKKYSEAELKEAVDARINGTQPTSEKAKQAYKELDIFFDDFHKYARQAFKEGGNKDPNGGIGYIKHYWPMLWDAEKVMKNREAFLKMITQPKYASYLDELKVTPTELWENISGYVTRGETFQGVMNPNSKEPVNSYSQKRSLSFLDPEDRKPFMNDNALLTMVHYVPMMVRQAEYVRAYGEEGIKLEKMLEEAEVKYGATPDQIARARDYIDGLLGNKEVGMSRELKDLYGAMIVYQNYRLLPFSLFSSLVDPLGVAVRSGSLADAFETFTYSMRNLFRDLKNNRPEASKDYWEKLAEDWGYIEDAGTMSNLRHMVETTELHGFSKKMNDALFKWNLLNGWTRSTKIMAVKAAHRFFLRSAEGTDAMSKRHLEELGLMKSDIISDGHGGIATRKEELMTQGVSEDQATAIEKRLHDATTNFVNQAILNPTAADLPNWGSNPYLAPIFHLKQFMFTFQNVILRRIISEMEQGNFKPLWVSGIYIPGMIGADFLRGMISNMGEQPPWQKDWGVYDYVTNGVEKSGLTGVGQMFLSMKDDVVHGGRGYESAVGPTIEQIMKGLQAVSVGDTRLWNFTVKSMPLNPIYDQWLLHAPTGAKNG